MPAAIRPRASAITSSRNSAQVTSQPVPSAPRTRELAASGVVGALAQTGSVRFASVGDGGDRRHSELAHLPRTTYPPARAVGSPATPLSGSLPSMPRKRRPQSIVINAEPASDRRGHLRLPALPEWVSAAAQVGRGGRGVRGRLREPGPVRARRRGGCGRVHPAVRVRRGHLPDRVAPGRAVEDAEAAGRRRTTSSTTATAPRR